MDGGFRSLRNNGTKLKVVILSLYAAPKNLKHVADVNISHFAPSDDNHISYILQGDSVARGPKLLSIKNYVIELMT